MMMLMSHLRMVHVIHGHRVAGTRIGGTASPVTDRPHVHFHSGMVMLPRGWGHSQHGSVVAHVQQGSAQAVMMVPPGWRWGRSGWLGRGQLQAARRAAMRQGLNLHGVLLNMCV
ncbi:hypothetical protein ABS71_14640 [bacterium SCN 62-11]|nr:MAG: hypothetical protein ABS71_14640 [bacterium SCN 62-11]